MLPIVQNFFSLVEIVPFIRKLENGDAVVSRRELLQTRIDYLRFYLLLERYGWDWTNELNTTLYFEEDGSDGIRAGSYDLTSGTKSVGKIIASTKYVSPYSYIITEKDLEMFKKFIR